ncbi:MAG TPA: hypothetical protein VFR31_07535, partial [Thermoanaerobaculia bacterium]|nr:hypothetical protein [Thermoanaerobaculia bacterium]
RRQVEQDDPGISECLLDPFLDRRREVEALVLDKLGHLPTGDDADAQSAGLMFLEEVQRRRPQTAISMNPPYPDVGIEEDH